MRGLSQVLTTVCKGGEFMRRYSVLLVALLLGTSVLSGCISSSRLGSAKRQTMSEDARVAYINQLQKGDKGSGAALYSEDGISIASDRKLVVESWKLNQLSKDYAAQNSLDYVTKSENLPKQAGDWMSSNVTTKDFTSTVRVYGDDKTMTLDIKLNDNVGKYVLAPQSCIVNGVLKDKTLFKAKETEKGHFLITAQMSDFTRLEQFGLTMGNISSLAWYLTAINTETNKMESFLLASSFPDDHTWNGLQVADKYEAKSGIVMWIMRRGDSAYLCTFNGSSKKLGSEVKVTASKGNLISDTFMLDVSSGEFTYQQLGFNVADVTVKKGDAVLLRE